MTIDELLAAVDLSANDEIPIWDAEATGEPTKKITAVNLALAVTALAVLVTGVKGDAESSYRQGNVNLTPANIGALPDTTFIPSKTSDITNDSGFLTAQTGVAGVKGDVENSYRQGNVNLTPANIGALASTGVLTPSAAFSIPAAGSSVSYSMAGMTASHILTHWNFSASPENAPPANLTWTTYEGYFTITNNGGTTAQTIKPVFELPTNVSITGI